jgi:50S ribosomal subunit-associated GTPase HflX
MGHTRSTNENLIDILMSDMKKMDSVVARLQQEVSRLRHEVQRLSESVQHSSDGPKRKGRRIPYNSNTKPDIGRETGKFKKQKESLREQEERHTSHSSNPWDDRGSTSRLHTISHF